MLVVSGELKFKMPPVLTWNTPEFVNGPLRLTVLADPELLISTMPWLSNRLPVPLELTFSVCEQVPSLGQHAEHGDAALFLIDVLGP